METTDSRKYLFAFIITAIIFATAIFISSHFNDKRVAEISDISEKISIDILALETQFDLLEDISCEALSENSILSRELNSLERRLSITEERLGINNAEVIKLKQSYSLLQIKDYLLLKRISEKCGLENVFVFYFYSNEGDCEECIKEGHVLTRLRQQYPRLRVYSFDYNLELSAIETLIAINKVEGDSLPAIIINNEEVRYGFQDIEDLENILPVEDLGEEIEATTTDKD